MTDPEAILDLAAMLEKNVNTASTFSLTYSYGKR